MLESLLKTQASMRKKEASFRTSFGRPHDLIGVPSLKVLTFFLACLVATTSPLSVTSSCSSVGRSVTGLYITHAN